MKLRDAIYGLAVGDALGVPYEFKERGSFKCTDMVGYGTHYQPAGTWSHDTSLTLATCYSIKECGGVDVEDIRRRFESWLYKGKFTVDGKVFDVGNTTREAIALRRGSTDKYAQGNGSLMRILPLVFVDEWYKYVDDVSSITHAHAMALAVCRCYLNVAEELIKGSRVQEIKNFKGISEKSIESSGYVVDTYNAALWCLANTDNYRDAVLKAVNLGDDTDTTAAVTGGLAGIIYGYDGIPKEWIEKLRGKDIIENCLF